MRVIVALIAALAAVGATAQEKVRCESQALFGDNREIRCPLDASETPRRFRFKANFSGGHDDTSASMTATLDGAPLACEPGSKTSLMGEDGDVSLDCRFSIVGNARPKDLLVTLSWRHAQYKNFELDAD